MSTTDDAALSAREKFLRRLEENQQGVAQDAPKQEREQDQDQDGNNNDDKKLADTSAEVRHSIGADEGVKLKDEVPPLTKEGGFAAGTSELTQKDGENLSSGDKMTLDPVLDATAPDGETPAADPDLKTPATKLPPSSPTTDDVALQYLQSCGLSACSLDSIDGSSLELLRQLSTPQVMAEDTPAGMMVPIQENDSSNVAPRSIDFAPKTKVAFLGRYDTTTSASSSKPPLSVVDLNKAPLGRMTSDLSLPKSPYLPKSSTGTEATTAGEGTLYDELGELEPWQKALFETLSKQSQALEDLRGRVEFLTEVVTAGQQSGQAWQSPPQEYQKRNVSKGRDLTAAPLQPANAPRTVPPAAPPRRQPNFLILPLLTSLVSAIFSVPLKLFQLISASFPIRLFKTLLQEARRQNLQNNLNAGLLVKLLFVCAIFGGRIGKRQKREREGFKKYWEKYRLEIFIATMVVVYLFQTGILKFLWNFFRDGWIGKVWRGTENEEEDGAGRDPEGEHLHGEGARRRRRGQQDRRAVPAAAGAADGGPNAENPPEGQNEDAQPGMEGQPAPPPRPPPPPPNGAPAGLGEGGIRRRDNGPVMNVVMDVVYFMASFVLSLLPTWKPGVEAAVLQAEREAAEEAERLAREQAENAATGGEDGGEGARVAEGGGQEENGDGGGGAPDEQ